MPKGTIKYFSESRGYGFIESEEEQRYYVHHSKILGNGYKTLEEGQEVTFDIIKSNEDLEAVNVHIL